MCLCLFVCLSVSVLIKYLCIATNELLSCATLLGDYVQQPQRVTFQVAKLVTLVVGCLCHLICV